MTSWNLNFCGPFNRRGHTTHMIDPDEDGNAVCVRPGCGHVAKMVCHCRVDADMAKYIGCPKHCVNPRAPMPRGLPDSQEWRACWPWLPEDMGGDLTLEEADRRARELIHVKR